jgi:hypothetical protein
MAESKKVDWEEYYRFVRDYNEGLFPNLRMGQAFMNKFEILDDQKLFYSQERASILEQIREKYITEDE